MTLGIVLAGGYGKRLAPLTETENKHHLPVYKQRMIEYPLATLSQCGVKDVVIVTGGLKPGNFIELIGNGTQYGFQNLFYTHQSGYGGIPDALACCEVIGKHYERCIVILGDNYFEAPLCLHADDWPFSGANVWLKPVEEPYHFGIAEVEAGKIVGLEEKPKSPKSNLAILGAYLFDSRVWAILKMVKPSARGEKEILDVLKYYMVLGDLHHVAYHGFWSDMGTFESLSAVRARLASK